MQKVVSYCDARAARLKQSLTVLAACHEGAIVHERRGRTIGACRIFCREQVVVLIDRYGVQSRLAYHDILDARPMKNAYSIASQKVLPGSDRAPDAKAGHAEEERVGNVIALRPRQVVVRV